MTTLIDQAERDRFVREHAKNISVLAPAGVGKTTSIVNRIVHLARLPEAEAIDRLPRLVVVTYSVRAAQQMQQKARVAIRDAKVSNRVQRAFQQTFFGTIHSYCVRLLDRFGHYLGLPSPVGLLQDDSEFWQRFLLRGLGQGMTQDANLRRLFHFYAPDKLYPLGQTIAPGAEIETGPCPPVDLRPVLDYRDNSLHHATLRTIVRAQDAARMWSEAQITGDRIRPLPDCPRSDKAADFAAIWDDAFAPLHDWLRHAALAFGRQVANAYEAFRLAEAVMTYEDQVRLALRVLDHHSAQRELASEKLSVLLDEAQDTDPLQFAVLQRVAGLGADEKQADDQSFSIVGDFQQAIYAPRSDLRTYQRVHDAVSAEPRGTSSRLQVTFRCDAAIIDLVNGIFPPVLNGAVDQCAFVPLVARTNAGPGQAVRWVCPDEPGQAAGEKISAYVRARHEARVVAQRLRDLGPAGLGADDWSQVAILCPRKDWLLAVQRELVELDLPVQLHSSNEKQSDRAPAAWLTALIWIAANPEDSFEIAGVLREIFGVADSDMAIFTEGSGDKLRLDGSGSDGGGAVESALAILREACRRVELMPLHEAVDQLVVTTCLRERLNSIEEFALENADRELDDFLAVVAERGAAGVTLAALADELRLGLTQVSPAEEEIRDAIQLLTSHKAKGLEWQVVVVPYVFRPIQFKAQAFPRVVTGPDGREMVCRDKADFDGQAEAFVSLRERQQLQRLLYVVATRAKRSLIWVDDEALYAGHGRRGGWSAAELLGFPAGENRTIWNALPEIMAAPEEILADRETVSTKPEVVAWPEVTPKDLRLARAHAIDFPHRTTPHALAVHVRDEAEPGVQAEGDDEFRIASSPGILYGTWWHEFVQTILWKKPMSVWKKKFREVQARSPQPERAEWEWDLFCRSKLAGWLGEPGRVVQVELPFLWPESPQSCLEGVMDLAVYTEKEDAWEIIDWKTNRVGEAGSTELVAVYRGQIEAYVRALRKMVGDEVRGSLYLTQTGEWVEVVGE